MTFKKFVDAFQFGFRDGSVKVTLWETPKGYVVTSNNEVLNEDDCMTLEEAKEWFFDLYNVMKSRHEGGHTVHSIPPNGEDDSGLSTCSMFFPKQGDTTPWCPDN
jgi:hypothetical protein